MSHKSFINRAVFLDRDGVINREVDVLRNIKQLKLLPDAAKAVEKINKLGFLAVILTNQPVIARGWLTEKDVEKINAVLIKRLGKKNAKIDAIYYCPHHPNANLKKYRMKCSCRKPNTGLIKKATKEFKIDIKKSFMVGDRTADILAGKRAGLKTILVKTGYAGKDGKHKIEPDFVAKNISCAVEIIKKHAK
ncbi:MAG: HAD-IIIA family hydrolase [Candidatus Liptonbacteria bacterium]|nr:HAD-IIIA family hydrolase [Candidatus Liptonbacteria bacterium]